MGKKLTQSEYEKRVKQCVGDKYSVVGTYMGKTKPILIHCNVHNIDFSVVAECYMRGVDDIRSAGCPECHIEHQNELYKDSREHVICAYCGVSFSKIKSKLINSRSGMYFCCREHKDMAQRIDSGSGFNYLRPSHYGEITSDYRTLAFRNYQHRCAICGYHEDDDISLLEVHHIDEDRENNVLENLIILCPICHKKLTSQKYVLIDRKEIIKKTSPK